MHPLYYLVSITDQYPKKRTTHPFEYIQDSLTKFLELAEFQNPTRYPLELVLNKSSLSLDNMNFKSHSKDFIMTRK